MIFALILVWVFVFRFGAWIYLRSFVNRYFRWCRCPTVVVVDALKEADAVCVAYAVKSRTEDVPSGCLAYSLQIAALR